MTKNELNKLIRDETNKLNKKLNEYYENGTPNTLFEKELNYVREVTGTSGKSKYIAMRLSGKTKAQLYAQLQELKFVGEWDTATPQGIRERAEKEEKAYRRFKRTTGTNIQFETWRKMINIFGSVGSEIMGNFGDSDVIKTVISAVKKGTSAKDIIKAMQNVTENNKSAGKTSVDYVQDLARELGIRK